MKIGLGLIGLCVPPREAVTLALEAEAAGFESVWVAEDTWYTGRDAVSLLGAIAWATRRVTLGTAVMPIHHSRHLQLLAATIASIDDLSGGRLIAGFGVGRRWPSYPADAKPLRMMREAVEGVRALIAGNRFDHQARPLQLQLEDGPLCWPPFPPVRARVPVYIAGIGPQMTALAVRLGDGLLLPLHTPVSEIAARVKTLRELASAAGRDPASIELVANVHVFASAGGEIDNRLRAQVAGVIAGLPSEDVAVAEGLDRQAVASVRAAVSAGGRWAAADLVTRQMIEAFCIAGTPAQCAGQLRAYAAAGLGVAILYPLGGDPRLVLEAGTLYRGGSA